MEHQLAKNFLMTRVEMKDTHGTFHGLVGELAADRVLPDSIAKASHDKIGNQEKSAELRPSFQPTRDLTKH